MAYARKKLRTGSADSYVTPIECTVVRFRDAKRSLTDPLALSSEPVSHSNTHVPISLSVVHI